ncbi:hypothetical protein ACFW6U_25190 [Pseudomonas guariconensis]|nr:hypothetical protein [Pseudomonas sp. BYT-5]
MVQAASMSAIADPATLGQQRLLAPQQMRAVRAVEIDLVTDK